MSGSKPNKTSGTIKPADQPKAEGNKDGADAKQGNEKPADQPTSTVEPVKFHCVLAGLGGTPVEVTATDAAAAEAEFRRLAPQSGTTPVTVTKAE